MRDVIASAFVSLDGVTQAPGGPEEDPTGGFVHGGWTVDYWNDDSVMGQAMGRVFAEPFDLLLGRKTYEIFAAHWPHSSEEPIASQFNAATKYVITKSAEPLAWNNSRAIHDAATDVARLKKEDGPTLLIQGSSDLVQTLLENDLIDRFTFLIFPLVLGRGKRFFGSGALPAALKLVDSQTSSTGVTINRYLRAGAISTGSFAHSEPNTAEIARRRKWASEGAPCA